MEEDDEAGACSVLESGAGMSVFGIGVKPTTLKQYSSPSKYVLNCSKVATRIAEEFRSL